MIFDRVEQNPGARMLFVLACLVVVVAGLRIGAPILIPFSLALFLAIVSLPVMVWLQSHRIPAPLAILVTVMVNVAVFGLIILLASQSVAEFQDRVPRYVARLQGLVVSGLEWLEMQGVPTGGLVITDLINPGAVADLVGGTLQRALAFLSYTFLVFLILIFILGEATVFPDKFRAIFGAGEGETDRPTKIVKEVQEYLGIKTVVSLATGLLLGLWCWFMNLDFPILLGLLAFALNYVPTIGSVLAAIPAMLLAVIQYSPGTALIVLLGYLVVNFLLGNLLEPTLLGRRLGLSTLVVLLSLLFWGWVWGPVGALLAVPLTMIVKIMLENTPDLRWVAQLLDKEPPAMARSGGPAEVDGTVDGEV